MGRENSDAALLAALASATTDRYRIERELGRGATSTVFLAVETKQGRHIAIKVLDQHLGATVGHDRFRREIDAVAKLLHPRRKTPSGLDAGRRFTEGNSIGVG